MKNKLLISFLIIAIALTGCGKQKNQGNEEAAEVLKVGMMSSLDVIPFELITDTGRDKK